MDQEILVFVYGTLKQGYGNHRLLAGRSVFMGPDCIKGELFDLGSFPAVVPGEDTVKGEVYAIGPNTLKDLDWLEGHPSFYERKQVKTLDKGHEVWVYFMNNTLNFTVKYLPGGVWGK